MITPEPTSSVAFLSLDSLRAGISSYYESIRGMEASVNEHDVIMPYAFLNPALGWTVGPNLERIDDAECHVVNANTGQRIWIDPAIGFAIRFRQRRWILPNEPWECWPIAHRNHYAQFQSTDDVFVPTRISRLVFHPRSTLKKLRGTPADLVMLTDRVFSAKSFA